MRLFFLSSPPWLLKLYPFSKVLLTVSLPSEVILTTIRILFILTLLLMVSLKTTITMCSLTSASTLDFNSQSRILNQKLSHTFSVFSMSPNIKLDIQYITNTYSLIFSSLSWPGLGNNLDHKYGT